MKILVLLSWMALLATAKPSMSSHERAGSRPSAQVKREVSEWVPFVVSEEEKTELEKKLNAVLTQVTEINSGRGHTLPTN